MNRSATRWATAGITALVVGLGGMPAANAEPEPAPVAKPAGVNPYLALLPTPDDKAALRWRTYLQAMAQTQTTPAAAAAGVDEQEPPRTRGDNDTLDKAQPIDIFGTDTEPAVRVSGTLAKVKVPIRKRKRNVEDDGSIVQARDTGIGTKIRGFRTSGRIGDGPHGSKGTGKGDMDTYKVIVKKGQTLNIRVNAKVKALDPVLFIWNRKGDFINGAGGRKKANLTFTATRDQALYVMVSGGTWPRNPKRSGSGSGVETEGGYRITMTQAKTDVDVYAVDLDRGDTLGVRATGGASLVEIKEGDGTLVQGSASTLSFIYPKESKLPRGGRAAADHVVDEPGRHYFAVAQGSGDYEILAKVARPGLEGDSVPQTIAIDFNGERIDTSIWGGPGERRLSALSTFLTKWGLTQADLPALKQVVLDTATENLKTDLEAAGINTEVKVVDEATAASDEKWGQDNVSRVIVGGTVEESGVDTIGIAQSIDPGNYKAEESALVLLDYVSSARRFDYSINHYLTADSDRVQAVGQALGNIVAHEAGHFFGNWHTDQFNANNNLQDQGGNFANMFGVGPDEVAGTADDVDVDFGEDVFVPSEGFRGTEDTLTRLSEVLLKPVQ